MKDTVYILIRTSGRPMFFARMMETIQNQTYKNIVTIVHSDDPRDEYVDGDIIIRGSAYAPGYGNAPYNFYNNTLLKAIPENNGWFHFIDDDDEYASDTVIDQLVEKSKEDHVNVGRVERWNGTIWPRGWKTQRSFQTECFFVHASHKMKANWWGHKGGDHYYSKQLTKKLPIHWIDNLIICKAQEGKGHGKKKDKGGVVVNYKNAWPMDKKIPCIGLVKHFGKSKLDTIRQGEMKNLFYADAYELEQKGIVKITHHTTYRQKKPVRQIYKI